MKSFLTRLGYLLLFMMVIGLVMKFMQLYFGWPVDLTYGEIFRMYLGPGW